MSVIIKKNKEKAYKLKQYKTSKTFAFNVISKSGNIIPLTWVFLIFLIL